MRKSSPEWVSVEALCESLGVARRTLFRWISRGRVPRPVKFGHRSTRWPAEVAVEVVKNGPSAPGTYPLAAAARKAAARVLRASAKQRGRRVGPVEDLGRIEGEEVVTYGHRSGR